MAALLLALAVTAPLHAQATVPLLAAVDPDSGTYNDVLSVIDDNLDQTRVAALYLTDGKNDIRLLITDQAATSMKFQIPAGIATGRVALMVLTKGKDAKYVEEPVKVRIEPPAGKITSSGIADGRLLVHPRSGTQRQEPWLNRFVFKRFRTLRCCGLCRIHFGEPSRPTGPAPAEAESNCFCFIGRKQ